MILWIFQLTPLDELLFVGTLTELMGEPGGKQMFWDMLNS